MIPSAVDKIFNVLHDFVDRASLPHFGHLRYVLHLSVTLVVISCNHENCLVPNSKSFQPLAKPIIHSASAAAMVSNLSGSGDQSILVADAKCDIGCASTPTLAIPIFLHSTIVVPVPQNGSRTHALAPNSNRLIYSRTKCGGNESTNRYQSCAARSPDSNRSQPPGDTGDLDPD